MYAVTTKSNLRLQTDKTQKIHDGITNLRNQEVQESQNLLDDLNNSRKRNLAIICLVVTMLFLGLSWIVYTNLHKHLGSSE